MSNSTKRLSPQQAKLKWQNIIETNKLKCKKCNRELSLENFNRRSKKEIENRGYLCYNSTCKDCRGTSKRTNPDIKILKDKYLDMDIVWEKIKAKGNLECTNCQQTKPLSEFQTRKSSIKDKLVWRTVCKECTYAKQSNNRNYSIKSRLEDRLRAAIARKKHEINVDINYLLELYEKQEGKCFYTGIELVSIAPKDSTSFNNVITIDRLDSNKGYIKGNLVLACWTINRMKSNTPVNSFIEICRKISSYMK